ncbi:PBP1A family penicillin-binding protein [Marivivens donghaensis]|uniref:Penicillin-binding protein 1A n=2 Tax=Marivivens donghaensis TaxID=1699413 RepID=A0ABX0VZU3_9RHOB|nr:PBP1A family penicillin-binding protein [Marivivens donghaensis]NIY72692.1 PBP1A family penicillin-binding protein [Marivivens donghaensis]
MSFFGAIFTMATLGIIMCALGLGAVFTFYGRDLPSYQTLSQYTPKTISRVYNGEGRIIDEFAAERRLFVPAEEIPDIVKYAFVSAEDQNFYTHPGYDIRGIVAAAVEAVQSRGSDIRGASTITQQVMKNFLLSSDRTAERKIKELILSVRIERVMSKDQIIELYLNEIFLGQNSYGVAAAAQSYFNKPLSDLTPGEAAYLAALAQRPGNLHPVRQYDDAVDRRNYVLRRMAIDGYISQEVSQSEREAPLRTVQSGDYDSFRSTLPPRGYFTDEIRRQLSRNFGEDEFFSGGLSIRATVDPELQTEAELSLQQALEEYDRARGDWRGTGRTIAAEALANEADWRSALASLDVPRDVALGGRWYPAVVRAVEENQLVIGVEDVQETEAEPQVVPRDDIQWMSGDFFENFAEGDVVLVRRMTSDSDGSFIRWTLRQVPQVEGAFMAMDVDTGRVLAMQGGFSYQSSELNRATQAERQPGSAFKPFVYAAALDSGYTPATIVVDAPIEIDTPQGLWRPQNASNQYYGPTPLRTGIEQSRNLMTIRLAQEVGMDTVKEYAERFGVYDNMGPYLSASLGAEETTLYKLVGAYAMFANGGERVEPTLVDRVQDRYGDTVYRHESRTCVDCSIPQLPAGEAPQIDSNRDRIMNAVTAYQLTSMLQGVVQRGTASRTVNLPVPTAGKTGTTNDSKDVWFVGFTSNIVAGCYIGYDTPRSLIGGSGGGFCGPVFQRFMEKAIVTYGGGPFEVPDECNFINIDRFTGGRLSDGASGDNVVRECFRGGEEPLFGIQFDGGFAMSADLPLVDEVPQTTRQVRSSDGSTATVGPNASFGTLSSGGLY